MQNMRPIPVRLMARVYTIDPTLRIDRQNAFCQKCGQGYRSDVISDGSGPISVWRSNCGCTRFGRTDLRAGRGAECPDNGHRPRDPNTNNGHRDHDLYPEGQGPVEGRGGGPDQA